MTGGSVLMNEINALNNRDPRELAPPSYYLRFYEPESESSADTKYASALILGLLSLQNCEKEISIYKPPLCMVFCYSSPTKTHTKVIFIIEKYNM